MRSPGYTPVAHMPWGKGSGGGHARRGYHHGRLKEALIEAARSLIERHGPQGFSLSEAAKLVGVTPAAPYRHFTDRDALMGEVAKRGYELFGERLEAAWNGGLPDAVAALQRMGLAYLTFARDEPGFYFTMFGHSQRLSAEGGAAADKTFELLIRAAEAVLNEKNARTAGARALAYEIWAVSHGVAALSLGRFLDAGDVERDPQKVLSDSVYAMIERAAWLGR
ncbi:MAG: TetR/AcrR family transcriptional regulator [Beijerinckiaceae bacterium]